MTAAALFRLPAWWHWPPEFLFRPSPGAYGFAVRTALAAVLALGAAYAFQLESPYWAATTALIVANPVYGQILAKSVYRIFGTVVGGVMTLVLAALFAQAPELFLLALSVWIGLCMTFATLLRNFTAYGAMLAGYTTAIIALAVVPEQPLLTFDTTLARVAAIFVGIASSALVSGLLKPGGAARNFELRLQGALEEAAELIERLEADPVAVMKPRRRRLAAKVLELDALVGFAGVESGRIQAQREQLIGVAAALLHAVTAIGGIGFGLKRMGAAERGNARLRATFQEGHDAAWEMKHFLTGGPLPDYAPARARLGALAIQARTEGDPPVIPVVIHRLRETLEHLQIAARGWQDWRLRRPLDAALRAKFDFHRDVFEAWHNGFRCFLAVLVASLFWIVTAWPAGATMVTIAAIFCCIASTQKDPLAYGIPFMEGVLLTIPIAYVLDFAVLTRIEGFVPLALVVAGPIVLGALAASSPHPRMAGISLSFLILFMTLLTPRNPMVYDAGAFFNSALATLVGAGIAIGCSVFFLPADPARRARQLIRTVCGEVEALARVRSGALPTRIEWESRMYDRLSTSIPFIDEAEEGRVLDSAFAALQIGASLIDLRGIADGPDLRPAWRRTLDAALDRLEGLARGAGEAVRATDAAARDLLEAGLGLETSPEGDRQRLLLVRAAASLEGISLLLADEGEAFAQVLREPEGRAA
jgi:uncharacterized membrane protein YccC